MPANDLRRGCRDCQEGNAHGRKPAAVGKLQTDKEQQPTEVIAKREANGFPTGRVRRIVRAIETLAGTKVGFLDASGVMSDFDSAGNLIPSGDALHVLSPSIIQESFRRPRPLLHRGHQACPAVSVPFLTGGRLAGFITSWGFAIDEPDPETAGMIRDRFTIDTWREVFGHRDNCQRMEMPRLLALVDFLEMTSAQITILSAQTPTGGERDSETPLSWAVSTALAELARAGAAGDTEAVHARERLEALYNSTQDAILMLDKDAKIVAANKEFGRIFDTNPEVFIGVAGTWLRRWVVKNAKNPACVNDQINALLSNAVAVLDDEIELMSPRHMILRFYSAPVVDKTQNVIGRVIMFRDITEFRRARTELIGSEKMNVIGRAAAGLAHELNNILAGVVTYADYALEEGKPEQIRDALRMSIAAAEKASSLVGEFLSVSEPTESLRQDVDLHLELERLLDTMEPDLRSQNIRVHRLLESVPRVSVDPVQVLKVFHNLLNNARDAVGRDGTITIRTETDWDRGTVRTIITDSGPGIQPEIIDRIFDPFFTTKGVVSGGASTAAKGLGLSIARGIVESHGGKIYAGNVLPHGASFVVELPLPGEPTQRPPSPSDY